MCICVLICVCALVDEGMKEGVAAANSLDYLGFEAF